MKARAAQFGAALLIALVLASATARAASRVANMRLIAASVYGPDVCGDTLAVPIMRGPMPLDEPNWVAYAHHEGDALPYTNCYIVVKDIVWPTERLCRTVSGHEYGHLAGLQHTPEDPTNIMWPYGLPYWKPCANGAANAR